MLIPYLKTIEIGEICLQCSMIEIMNLMIIILTILDSITVTRNPTIDNELSNKICRRYFGRVHFLRFSQTLQNYLKVSVAKDVYNHTKYDRIQTMDTAINKFPDQGRYLFQQWNIN